MSKGARKSLRQKMPVVVGHQRGFSLVELMIAMVLGLLVAAGATQLFLTTSSSFSLVNELNRRQEVVSYVANVLGGEIRSASNVFPVLGGSPDSESPNLQIEFDEQPFFNDVYCSSGDELTDLEYFVDSGYLKVDAVCSSVVQGEQSVISGVESVTFSQGLVDGENAYVGVSLELEGLGQSGSIGNNEINYLFTRHSRKVFE